MSFKNIVNMFRKEKTRDEEVLAKCGCLCRCPECNDILNDQAECWEDELVHYKCECGYTSNWAFHIAPLPILIDNKI